MITLMEAEKRVELGAYFLDLVAPGWRERVNPATLSVRSGFCCPLGQTYGSYCDGVEALMLGDEVIDLGFFSPRTDDYVKLDMAWGRELSGV